MLALVAVLNAFAGSVFGSAGIPYPFEISNKAELEAVNYDLAADYILVNDIDLTPSVTGEPSYTRAVIAPDESSSSGYNGTPFTGSFNGNGFKIIGLTINGPDNDGIGLFGCTYSGAVIKNVTIEGCDITGDYYVAALVGYNDSIITNCYASGVVTGDDYVGSMAGVNVSGITGCYATCNVSGDGGYTDNVGGLVGRNEGSITNSYATGTVIDGGYVGGLVGRNGGSIANCYARGYVSGAGYSAGGLVGYNFYGSITHCYSTGFVGGTSIYFGGLVGSNSASVITNSFWDTQTSGQTTSDGGTGKTTFWMQTQSTFTTAEWDFAGETLNNTNELWQMPAAGGYPELTVFDDNYTPAALSGNGSTGTPYLIGNANELGAAIHYDLSAHYKLTNDIDLAGMNWKVAVIPVFAGNFDGNGYKITNLTINGSAYLGLFGQVGNSGVVENLSIENCDISATGDFVAGLTGLNNGNIADCNMIGTVSGNFYVAGLVGYNVSGDITHCFANGTVSGHGESIGGLVGYNFGSIAKSCANCSVSSDGVYHDINSYSNSVGGLAGNNGNWLYPGGSITESYSTGSVAGDVYQIGGLVGENAGSISNSYSIVSVVGTDSYSIGGLVGDNMSGTITDCYAAGDVSGTGDLGGLVGYNDNIITNSFWCTDVQTHGVTVGVGDGSGTGTTGKTTGELQTQSTLTDWDFVGESGNGTEDTWRMCVDGVSYPKLTWEFARHGDVACEDGVDTADLLVLAKHWLIRYGNAGWYSHADINADGIINLPDLAVIAANWLIGTE